MLDELTQRNARLIENALQRARLERSVLRHYHRSAAPAQDEMRASLAPHDEPKPL